LRKFVYGPGIDEPICMIDVTDNNKIYYYHFDGLGTVVALSDSNAVIVEQYSYDVFGKPNRTSSINNPYFFTGRQYDEETGLYYYRARYYDCVTGRFLQTDPVGYTSGLNLYAYVQNNPISWIDPFGLLNKHHDVYQTRIEMNRAKNTLNPLAHIVSSEVGGLDYKYTGDSFNAPLIIGTIHMEDSEFGNMIAGYRNSYNQGPLGTIAAYSAGIIFASSEWWESNTENSGLIKKAAYLLPSIPVGVWMELTDGSTLNITRGVIQGYAEVGTDAVGTVKDVFGACWGQAKMAWDDFRKDFKKGTQ